MECERLGQEGLPYRISVRGSFRLGAEVKHPWLEVAFFLGFVTQENVISGPFMCTSLMTDWLFCIYSYNRFIQSKDLSSKSAEDMACIFGQRSKSAPGTPQEQSEVGSKSLSKLWGYFISIALALINRNVPYRLFCFVLFCY